MVAVLLDLATRRARELGISRSEFFARAVRRYLNDLSTATLTRQFDDALSAVGAGDSGQAAERAGRMRLAGEADG